MNDIEEIVIESDVVEKHLTNGHDNNVSAETLAETNKNLSNIKESGVSMATDAKVLVPTVVNTGKLEGVFSCWQKKGIASDTVVIPIDDGLKCSNDHFFMEHSLFLTNCSI